MKIAVVDDEPLTLRAVRRLLARAGHEVVAFESGGAALDWFVEGRPDAVILDVVMPGLSGYEVCRRLRAMPAMRRVPVIFLTSKNRSDDMVEARAAGSDLFVVKPVLGDRLLSLLAGGVVAPRAAASR
jgi:DNA-binding response OmpR family regulator